MDPVTLIVLAGVGVGGWALRRSHLRHVRRQLAAGSRWEDDADVAIHVAGHEARSRGHVWLTPLHVLYGLLQDEAVIAAVTASGGDPSALEDRTLASLAGQSQSAPAVREGAMVLGYARAYAEQRGARAGCTELWAALRIAPDAVRVLAAAGVDHAAVLFRLFHGDEPALGERLGGELDVVLRNDHYTTKEFVCEVLEEVFALPPEVAATRMEAVHQQGSAVVGRYRAADARAKVAETRRRARAHGFPLWVAVEPA